jgi:hypothetical protein
MIAILATAPDGSSYAAYVNTNDLRVARVEARALERLGYTHSTVIPCPSTARIEDYNFEKVPNAAQIKEERNKKKCVAL